MCCLYKENGGEGKFMSVVGGEKTCENLCH